MNQPESQGREGARDRLKGSPVIRLLAARVAVVPLAELAGADGAPRPWFRVGASDAFAAARARTPGCPGDEPSPAGAPEYNRLVAEAVLACRAEIRAAVASLTVPPGTSPEAAEVTWALFWMAPGALEAIAGGPQALLLCDGCYQAATGEIAVCEDGCPRDLDHAGLCLREGPDDCQWCGQADRLREVPRSGILHLLPTVGEEDGSLWWLRFTDGAQGPYRSRQEAWDAWHAGPPGGEGGDRA
jgi:hypothetical protein